MNKPSRIALLCASLVLLPATMAAGCGHDASEAAIDIGHGKLKIGQDELHSLAGQADVAKSRARSIISGFTDTDLFESVKEATSDVDLGEANSIISWACEHSDVKVLQSPPQVRLSGTDLQHAQALSGQITAEGNQENASLNLDILTLCRAAEVADASSNF